ncbi:MAG: cytochrome c4 [Gammaproteobacteria bacterium]|nr:cytochrome c4 [Gammaproteobacteria bacterium]
MRYLLLGVLVSVVLTGCTDKQEAVAPDISAGRTIAEANCVGCHGLDGRGAAPGIPHLAAQVSEYLLASLHDYQEGTRTHAALRDLTEAMSDADIRNVVGYYASLPPVKDTTMKETQETALSPFEKGKARAAVCASCHGEGGHSKVPGTPSLAGQQPLYFVAAVRAYLDGSRSISTMEATLRGLSNLDMQNMALYYASQTPIQRDPPAFGDAVAGEPLTARCGGCHGAGGVSHDAATPSLAGQDAQYLVSAIKAYRDRTTRHVDVMLVGSSDKQIEDIAAFYAVQKPKAAQDKPISAQELAKKCDRCHDPAVENPAMAVPKIGGQNKDYLLMALRAYRDGKRESSMMHNMSLPYSDTLIESVASWYASQPAR